MDIGTLALYLGMMFLLIALNALFVATEFALVASRRSKIKELAESGSIRAKQAQKLQQNMGMSVSGTQLGITLASLGLGSIGENVLNDLVNMLFSLIPGTSPFVIPVGAGVFLTFFLLSAFHVVLGEQVPKFLALRIPEKLTLFMAPIFRAYCQILWPLLWVMNRSAESILRLCGIPKPPADSHFVYSADELQILFEASKKAGELGERESDLLKKVLDLRSLTMNQVLVPVEKLDAVSVKLNLAELLTIVTRTKHSKLPVYSGSVNNIIGVLYICDLFDWWLQSINRENNSNRQSNSTSQADQKRQGAEFKLERFLRAAYTVLDTAPASTLLDDLRNRKTQIAIVKDRYGKTVGIVTMEDIIEELVGEISDEFDKQ